MSADSAPPLTASVEATGQIRRKSFPLPLLLLSSRIPWGCLELVTSGEADVFVVSLFHGHPLI